MSLDYGNALRHRRARRWFDFWNARVVLPERELFFYLMPFVLSGEDVPTESAGLYLYDGGNGGRERQPRFEQDRLPASVHWSASREACDVRWSEEDGVESRFTASEISARGPTTRWDVRIEPHLADEQKPASADRPVAVAERMMLQLVPFIHRVPRMKGWASGTIEQDGCTHRFERAPFYQAKNHGTDLPEAWTWIHGNAFAEDEDLAIEAACLRTDAGATVAMARVARAGGTRLLGTWRGDQVAVEEQRGDYRFRVSSSEGDLSLEGTARHGVSVSFTFPAPGGGRFENDECLLGALEANLDGRRVRTRAAALGRTRRVRPEGG